MYSTLCIPACVFLHGSTRAHPHPHPPTPPPTPPLTQHHPLIRTTTANGNKYSSRMSTRPGYQTIRLPFNLLRGVSNDEPLDPTQLTHLSIRFEPRVERAAVVVPGAGA